MGMRNNRMSKDREARESKLHLRYDTRARWQGCTACAGQSGETRALRLETPAGTKPSVPAEGFGYLPEGKEKPLKH